jgi:hypothetical protein
MSIRRLQAPIKIILQNLRIPPKLDMNQRREVLALNILISFYAPGMKVGNPIPTPTPMLVSKRSYCLKPDHHLSSAGRLCRIGGGDV